jgi:hypothetical protein
MLLKFKKDTYYLDAFTHACNLLILERCVHNHLRFEFFAELEGVFEIASGYES